MSKQDNRGSHRQLEPMTATMTAMPGVGEPMPAWPDVSLHIREEAERKVEAWRVRIAESIDDTVEVQVTRNVDIQLAVQIAQQIREGHVFSPHCVDVLANTFLSLLQDVQDHVSAERSLLVAAQSVDYVGGHR